MSIVICEKSISDGKKKVRYVQVDINETMIQEENGYRIFSSTGFLKHGYSNEAGNYFVVMVDGVQVAKVTGS